MDIICVENLTKKYDHFKLDNLNLQVPAGSVIGLVGANGAGKTTLIKLLLGIIKKDAIIIKIHIRTIVKTVGSKFWLFINILPEEFASISRW